MGLRAHRDLGEGDRDHRRVAARAGSGNELRADRRRSAGRADRGRRGAARRHRTSRITAATPTAAAAPRSAAPRSSCASTRSSRRPRRWRRICSSIDSRSTWCSQTGSFTRARLSTREIGWAELAGEAYVAKNLPAGRRAGPRGLELLRAAELHVPVRHAYRRGRRRSRHRPGRDQRNTSRSTIAAPQINPLLVEGQVQGGIAHSIGQALFEQTVYDENGQLLTGEFMDYAMPRASDIPGVHPGQHRHAFAGQSAGRQRRRRGGHDRRDAGDRQRRASTRSSRSASRISICR